MPRIAEAQPELLAYLYGFEKAEIRDKSGRITRIIAEGLRKKPPTIHALLGRMEDKGLIWRNVGPRKTFAAGLTPAGVRLAKSQSPNATAAKKPSEQSTAMGKRDLVASKRISDLVATAEREAQKVQKLKQKLTTIQRTPAGSLHRRIAELEEKLDQREQRIGELEQAYSDARQEIGTERERCKAIRSEISAIRARERGGRLL